MICEICKKNLVGKYYIDPWGRNVCEKHIESGDVVLCNSCYRYVHRDFCLDDGRVLCKVCFENCVLKTTNLDNLKEVVLNQLSNVGFNNLRIADISSIEVVSAIKIAQLKKVAINTQNKGLALSKISQTLGGLVFSSNKKYSHNIYILSHLTKAECMGVMAHEMLHAWQAQNEVKLSPMLTEGLCNMGAYLIYTVYPNSVSEILLKGLHESTDPVYGDGFRYVYAVYKKNGWKALIAQALNNKL